jgi:hypothetical protein
MEVFERVRGLGRECVPPYPPSECDHTVRAVLRTSNVALSNRWIADTLDIKPAEAEQLDTLPAASRFGDVLEPQATRSEGLQARNRLIQFILRGLGGELPSVRRMAEMMAGYGLLVSFKTVANDYRRMGLTG